MFHDDGEKNVCLELEQPKIKAGSLLSEVQKKKKKGKKKGKKSYGTQEFGVPGSRTRPSGNKFLVGLRDICILQRSAHHRTSRSLH